MRKEKQLLLDEIKDKFSQFKDFVITSYDRLDPNTAADFRTSIINTGGCFSVVKKRIFLKATREAGIDIDQKMLTGHIGIIYSGNDLIATAKVIYEFKDKKTGLLDVLGGQFEGKPCLPSDLKELSALPSREQMRAQLLGVFEVPLSGLLSVIENAMTGVVSCMDQQMKKKELEQ